MVAHTQNSCSTFTHPSAHTQQWTHTHPEQWAAMYAAVPGEQLGVQCLAQGHLVMVLKVERVLYIHFPHRQSLLDRDSNSQPFDYESDSLPLGHNFPLDNKCIYWSSYSILACFCKFFNSCIEFHEKQDLYLNDQHHNVVLYQVSYQANLLHQRNHTYGAGHVMWMSNGLLYKFPSNKSERTKSSLPGTVALNITKNIREATEYNNFQIWYKLLAPQSEQTRHSSK